MIYCCGTIGYGQTGGDSLSFVVVCAHVHGPGDPCDVVMAICDPNVVQLGATLAPRDPDVVQLWHY